jgi:hypothetical protein
MRSWFGYRELKQNIQKISFLIACMSIVSKNEHERRLRADILMIAEIDG